MGWSVGYDPKWKRDIGHGVPSVCDRPDCTAEIDRGLSYVCGGEPYGGDLGCGLYFCSAHLCYVEQAGDWSHQVCDRCAEDEQPFDPKPDVAEWINHKLTDQSWLRWRYENPDEVRSLERQHTAKANPT